jgi:mono/diheme cytochrome c family protein
VNRALSALVLLAGLLAGCAPAYRGEPLVGPLDVSAPQVALGQRVFAANCDQCHPGGAGGLGPSLNDKPLPGGLIAYQVRNGLGAMPAFSEVQLADEELDALILYLVRLREHEVSGHRTERNGEP